MSENFFLISSSETIFEKDVDEIVRKLLTRLPNGATSIMVIVHLNDCIQIGGTSVVVDTKVYPLEYHVATQLHPDGTVAIGYCNGNLETLSLTEEEDMFVKGRISREMIRSLRKKGEDLLRMARTQEQVAHAKIHFAQELCTHPQYTAHVCVDCGYDSE